MEDHKLEVFCAVIEYESFSRAAEAKFLTQSAISHLIKGLEKDLGTPLLYRHTRAQLNQHRQEWFFINAPKKFFPVIKD
jgi:DNA-binding transcriptional LysR family regulator